MLRFTYAMMVSVGMLALWGCGSGVEHFYGSETCVMFYEILDGSGQPFVRRFVRGTTGIAYIPIGDCYGGKATGLTADLSDLPPGNDATFQFLDGSRGKFTWTPTADDRGRMFVIRFTARNDTATHRMTLPLATALPGPDLPPILVAEDAVYGQVGQPLIITAHGRDPNDEPIEKWFCTIDASFQAELVSPIPPAVDTVAVFRFVPTSAGEWSAVLSASSVDPYKFASKQFLVHVQLPPP